MRQKFVPPQDLKSTANNLQQKKKRYNDDRDNEPKQNGGQDDPLKDAATLYVGNLSFYTTEEQIHELFSK